LGEAEIMVPRDRSGEFEPQARAKRRTSTDDPESRILAMYSGGCRIATWRRTRPKIAERLPSTERCSTLKSIPRKSCGTALIFRNIGGDRALQCL
ncbi:MAG: hypothetical protein GX592_09415, partial [Clostridiales bacterium]|nr:hypothetical protein [Clostridiales bacterium]